MSEFCDCTTSPPNPGQPKCIESAERDRRFIFMYTIADDGTYNEVLESDFVDGKLTSAFLTAKFNHVDPSKRWYLGIPYNTPDPVREENVTQDVDGMAKTVRQGNLNYTGMIYGKGADPIYTKDILAWSCKDTSVMTIDVSGNLKGKEIINASGVLAFRGRVIEPDTMKAIPTDKKADALRQIAFGWTLSETEVDYEFSFITQGATGLELQNIAGVVDVTLELSSITTLGATLTATFKYGPFGTKQPHLGLTDAELIFTNVTDDPDLAITIIVTEVGDGVYTFTYAVQDGGDTVGIDLNQPWYMSTGDTGLIPT